MSHSQQQKKKAIQFYIDNKPMSVPKCAKALNYVAERTLMAWVKEAGVYEHAIKVKKYNDKDRKRMRRYYLKTKDHIGIGAMCKRLDCTKTPFLKELDRSGLRPFVKIDDVVKKPMNMRGMDKAWLRFLGSKWNREFLR